MTAGERLILSVRVTPRASRDRLERGRDGGLAARLSAPPVDGAANTALLRLLADALDLPRGHVVLVGGATSRRKRVAVDGDPALIRARLAAMGLNP